MNKKGGEYERERTCSASPWTTVTQKPRWKIRFNKQNPKGNKSTWKDVAITASKVPGETCTDPTCGYRYPPECQQFKSEVCSYGVKCVFLHLGKNLQPNRKSKKTELEGGQSIDRNGAKRGEVALCISGY